MLDMILLGVESVLNVVALVFFATSIGASSYHFDVIRNTNWVIVSEDSAHLYLGFKAAAISLKSDGVTFTQVTHISDCGDAADDACKKCGDIGGKTTMALLAVALGVAGLSMIFTLARFSNSKNTATLGLQLVSMIVCVAFGIAAFCKYTPCYDEARDTFPDNDVNYGPGFILDVVASFLMFLSFVMGFISCCLGGEPAAQATNPPTAVPTREVEVADKA